MARRIYVQFMQSNNIRYDEKSKKLIDVEPYDQDMLASEGYAFLDARKRLDNLIEDAKKAADRLRFVHHITAFKIMIGDLKKASCIYHQKYDNGFFEARKDAKNEY